MSDLEQISKWFRVLSTQEAKHSRILRGWIILFGVLILISIWLK